MLVLVWEYMKGVCVIQGWKDSACRSGAKSCDIVRFRERRRH